MTGLRQLVEGEPAESTELGVPCLPRPQVGIGNEGQGDQVGSPLEERQADPVFVSRR